MAAIRFTDDDRDDRGFVKVPTPASQEPRSLADLLPTPQGIHTDAAIRKPISKGDQAMAIVAAIGLAVVLFWRFGIGGDVAPPVPASAPATAQTSGAGTPVPSPPPAAAALMLPAYDRPDGATLGQIEATRAITPTAHYGSAWIQADVAGSGLIWLRASDFPRLAIVGPDLAPRAAVAPPPAAVDTPAPVAACVTAGMGNQTVTVCGWDGDAALQAAAAAKWAAAYGGHVGSGDIHPSPQPWQRQDAIQNHLANEHIPTEEATP